MARNRKKFQDDEDIKIDSSSTERSVRNEEPRISDGSSTPGSNSLHKGKGITFTAGTGLPGKIASIKGSAVNSTELVTFGSSGYGSVTTIPIQTSEYVIDRFAGKDQAVNIFADITQSYIQTRGVELSIDVMSMAEDLYTYVMRSAQVYATFRAIKTATSGRYVTTHTGEYAHITNDLTDIRPYLWNKWVGELISLVFIPNNTKELYDYLFDNVFVNSQQDTGKASLVTFYPNSEYYGDYGFSDMMEECEAALSQGYAYDPILIRKILYFAGYSNLNAINSDWKIDFSGKSLSIIDDTKLMDIIQSLTNFCNTSDLGVVGSDLTKGRAIYSPEGYNSFYDVEDFVDLNDSYFHLWLLLESSYAGNKNPDAANGLIEKLITPVIRRVGRLPEENAQWRPIKFQFVPNPGTESTSVAKTQQTAIRNYMLQSDNYELTNFDMIWQTDLIIRAEGPNVALEVSDPEVGSNDINVYVIGMDDFMALQKAACISFVMGYDWRTQLQNVYSTISNRFEIL